MGNSWPAPAPHLLDSSTDAQTTLLDFLPIYRAAHPIPGETVKMTFVGQSEGRLRRNMQKFLVFIVVCVPVTMALREMRGGPSPRASTAIGVALGLLTVKLMWLVIRRIQGPRPDESRGVMISDARVVLFQKAKHHEPSVMSELPAGAVTWGRVDKVEEFWVTGGLTRLVLGGATGAVITLDLPRVNPRSVQLVLQEANLTVLQSATAVNVAPERRIAGWRPSWMLRGLGISLGLLFGAFAVLGVIGSVAEGQMVALVVSLVLAVVLLGGAAILIIKSRQK